MAMHPSRSWNIQTYEALDEMCRDVTKQTWTLCSGFRWKDIILVNDSFSESSLQEYAALRPNGDQIDSITVDWCQPERLAEIIQDMQNGGYDAYAKTYGKVELKPHPDDCMERA